MKQSIIILTTFLIFLTQSMFSQTIIGLSISPITEGIEINLTTYDANVFSYGCHDYSIDGNVILLKVAYFLTVSPTATELENSFEIALADDENDYTFQVEIYSADNYPNCTYDTLIDSNSLSFSTPLTETITLSNTEFTNIEDQISIYPNPTNGLLNIESSTNLKINSISLYNHVGAKILTIDNSINILDIRSISLGVYLLKITTNKGDIIKQVIKSK